MRRSPHKRLRCISVHLRKAATYALMGDEFEDLNCPCDKDDGEMRRLQREADAEEARAYKTLHAEVGKGKGRRSGRAAPNKDRKAHNQDNGKGAELCTEGMGAQPVPQSRTGVYLEWIAHNANKLKERCRSGGSGNKGNEKGNGKEGGKHLEELKCNVKKARETVEGNEVKAGGSARRCGSG